MSKTEKRELIEQQRKIFEAGAQRVDRRTGSFSFLTWSFFLAPLIAVEEFLSSTFRSAAAEEEDAKAVQAGATSHVMNNDPPAIDLFKANAVDETTKGAATSLQAHADQAGGTELLAGPLEDAAEPNSEATAATRSGGRNDDSQLQGAHDLIHGSSVNALVNSQLPASSAPESSQANVLAGTPSHDVAAAAAPVEAVVQPVLATATDMVGTPSHDVAAAAAPVEAVVQPVLATATDTVGTPSHDVAAAAAPVEAVVQPVLATATDMVGTPSHDVTGAAAPVEAVVQPVLATATDTVGTLSHDVAAAAAPAEAVVQPVLATATDTVGTLSHDVAAAAAPVEAVVQPVLATATDAVGTLSHDVAAAAAPVEAVVQPVLATATDMVGTLSHDVAAAAAPVEAVVQPVLATATDTVGTPSHDVAAAAAPVEAVVQPALATATATVGTLSHDATTEPLTTTAAISNDLTSDVSHPASTGASVSHPADTLLALATATDAPIQLPVSPPTASAQPVPDIQPTVAADVIALQNAPPPPANALFNGNEYTQYGVTLSSDVAASPQGAASSADAALAQHTSVSAVADVQHAPPPPDIVDPAHTTDHHAIL